MAMEMLRTFGFLQVQVAVLQGKSDGEVMRFCQAFMTELQRHIGARPPVNPS